MDTPIRISPTLALPIDAITQTFAILGKRGRGKTNTAVVLAEELIRSGLPVVVCDTVGAWWGLRSSADGKAPGLDVVVFGGDHGDVPLDEAAGKLIADVILEHRISAVVDTSILSKAGARRFLTAFVTEIYHRNREPLHVIFDEADELAPQRPGAEGIKLLGAMEDFVRRGRLRGLGCTLVTQRPAVLHKDVLTQAEVLVSMGMTGPRDVAAINEWVQLHADDGQAKVVRDSLASLPVGTGWVWSPEWLGILQRVEFRQRTTFDSSATPKVGQVRVLPTARAKIDLAQLGEQIAAMAEKQKADDPVELRRTIARLEKQLREQPAGAPVEQEVVKFVEVPVITAEHLAEVAALRGQFNELVKPLAQLGFDMVDTVSRIEEAIRRATPKVAGAEHKAAVVVSRPASKPSVTAPRPAVALPVVAEGDVELTGPERRILAALAPFGTRSHKQLAVLAGYKPSSSGFKNPLAHLRATGLAQGGGEAIVITDAGYAALGDYEPLPTGRALVDHWLSKLTGPEARILSALIDAYPTPVTAQDLAERTGYAHTSSGFKNPLAKLRSHQLAMGGGSGIVAAQELGEA